MDEPLLQFFKYKHLPEHQQEIYKPYCDLAVQIVESMPRNSERTVALRKLLESKEAVARTMIFKQN